MRNETKKYAQEAFEIVEHASKKIGSRLPGSDGEKKFAAYMAQKLRDIGVAPVTEEFGVSPRSAIGGLPYTGWVCMVMSALCYFALSIYQLWFGMSLFYLAATIWLFCGVFMYKTWFDMFFHQEISQNVYGVLEPEDGKYDYTIILSGHLDTCWTWKHSEHSFLFRNSKPILGFLEIYLKVGYGRQRSGRRMGGRDPQKRMVRLVPHRDAFHPCPDRAGRRVPRHVERQKRTQRVQRRHGQRHRRRAGL